MKRPITPKLLLLSALAGWLNREQQQVLDYLREENRVLREQVSRGGLTILRFVRLPSPSKRA